MDVCNPFPHLSKVINITKKIDFLSDDGLIMALRTITEQPRCVLFISLPCTSGCYFNVAINSKIQSAQSKLAMNKKEFEALWQRLETLCEIVG